MMWTVSNLFPRPDRPTMGAFNVRLFREMGERVALRNVCLVPSWRLWQWARIRAWTCPRVLPFPTSYVPAGYVPLLGRNWSSRLYADSLRFVAREWNDADSVLAAWLYPDGAAVARIGQEVGARVWIMVQGSDTFHPKHSVRRREILRACASAAGVICVASHLKRRLVDAGVDAEKVHVVPNGVDTGVFGYRERAGARRELVERGLCAEGGAGGRWILFVGNLVPVKNPQLLLEAFEAVARMAPAGSSSRLIVVGDGPLRRSLEAQAARAGVAGSARFVGVRPTEEVATWMAASDCLCLCSRDEGMPNVVLEALACGLPVVATDVGACRELLAGEASCRLVRSGEAGALAEAIRAALDTAVNRPELAARHGTRTWGTMAEEILGLMG